MLGARLNLFFWWLAQTCRVTADWCLRISIILAWLREINSSRLRSGYVSEDSAWSLAAAIGTAPFVLFSPLQGALSNALPRRWVVVGAALAAFGIVSLDLHFSLPGALVLGLVFTTTAIHSPAFYGALPAGVRDAQLSLSQVTGWVELGVNLALMLGIFLGLSTPLPPFVSLSLWSLVAILACLAYFPSDQSRPEPVRDAIHGFFRDFKRIIKVPQARNALLWLACMMGLLSVGAGVFLMPVLRGGERSNFDNFAKMSDWLRESFKQILPSLLSRSGLLVVFIGLASGAMIGTFLNNRQTNLRRSLGLVPLGLLAILLGVGFSYVWGEFEGSINRWLQHLEKATRPMFNWGLIIGSFLLLLLLILRRKLPVKLWLLMMGLLLVPAGCVLGLILFAVTDELFPSWPCVFMGIAGVFLCVPLRANYFAHVPADARGNAGAVLNFVNNLAMVFFNVLVVLVMNPMWVIGGSSPGSSASLSLILLEAAGLAGLVAAWVWRRELLEIAVEMLFAPFYRVQAQGPGCVDFPLQGPVLVIANHAAWIDPLCVAKVIPRTTYPMMTSVFFDLPFMRWLMVNVVHAIRVPHINYRREAPELEEAIDRLKSGDVVLLFPEGWLRRTEERYLRQFGQGVWRILCALPNTPIVICWIEGNWGSFTSYYKGPPTKRKSLDYLRPIRIAMAEPIQIDPALLTDQQATRRFLMQQTLATRSLLGLEVPTSFEEPTLDEVEQDGEGSAAQPGGVTEEKPPTEQTQAGDSPV